MFYFWLVIVIFLGFLEAATVNLVSIWFIVSGLVALVVSFFTKNFIIQFGIFVILGLILMVTTRKSLQKMFSHKEKTNLDRIIGTKGIVTETIEKYGVGEVKVDGKRWSAIGDTKIEEGTLVKILEINGVKLKVEKWEEK
jgi:membrane protein implicated in regulation of membrane protease activity